MLRWAIVRIYFDHNATTPALPEVVTAVARALTDRYGNPSSIHAYGQLAKAELDEARAAVAALIDADPHEIVFTSGGTEAGTGTIVAVHPRRSRALTVLSTASCSMPIVTR